VQNIKTENQRKPITKYKYSEGDTENKKKDIKQIRCFKCNKFGHYSSGCNENVTPNGNGKIYTFKTNDVDLDIDRKKVVINELSIQVVFDTGATDSIIPERMVRQFGNVLLKICLKNLLHLVEIKL
jgi:hypothetical protein